MVFIGLGISTLSASGQKTPERPPMNSINLLILLSKTEEFQLILARGIVRQVNVVSKVSDLQITQSQSSDGESDVFVTFTAETTKGAVFEGFECQMSNLTYIRYKSLSTLPGAADPAKPGFYLTNCESSEARFDETATPYFYLDEFRNMGRKERLR